MSPPESEYSRSTARRRSTVWAWVFLAVLLVAAVIVWQVRRLQLAGASEARFDAATHALAEDGLERALEPYARFVDELAAKAEGDGLTREEFLADPGIDSIESKLPANYAAIITERTPDEDLPALGERISTFEGSFGTPTVVALDPGTGRTHQVIVHAAPDLTRFNAIGLDVDFLISEGSLLESTDTGAALVGVVDFTLIDEIPQLLDGSKTPEDLLEAEASGPTSDPGTQPVARDWLGIIAAPWFDATGEPAGVAAMVVFLEAAVAPAVQAEPGIGLDIEGPITEIPLFQELQPGGEHLLAAMPGPPVRIVGDGYRGQDEATVFGAPWQLGFTEMEGFPETGTAEEWVWLGAGVLISLALFGLAYSQLRARDRAYEMVDEATADLRVSEERFRRAFESEKELAERLREADELKAEFVSMASHELRTPLTAATAFVDTVLLQWDRLDDDKRKELLSRASGNAKELTRLIDQLLASVRLDDAAMAVEPEPLGLLSLVSGVVEPIAPLLADHELDIEIDDAITVMAGSEAFSHVLGNLLTNAAKYSEPGTPIRVSARRTASTDGDDGAGMVAISVSDEGDGIPPEDLERVFERFFQSTASTRSSRAGLGVGLAIVRRYVEALGGEISVASTVGEGSTFTFTLRDATAPSEPSGGGGAQDEPART
ncbi:MAG: HAMP domain-containing sensor histidine kinase [Acidimicrobiia bacterium]